MLRHKTFSLPRLTYIINVLLFSVIYCAATASASSNIMPKSLSAATLEYPPYEYTIDGEPRGIAVEIIQEAVKRTGVEHLEFHFFPWKRAVYSVENGHNDILFNAGKNQARQEWGHYVDTTLILQKYVLFKRRNDDITVNSNFDNVENYSIAVRLGYLYGSGKLRQSIDNNNFLRVEQSKSTQQSIDMLLANRVDMLVGDYLPVMHYIKKNNLQNRIDIIKRPDIPTENMVVLTWPTYMLFNKDRVPKRYIRQINLNMEEMKKDGFIDAVFDKYRY